MCKSVLFYMYVYVCHNPIPIIMGPRKQEPFRRADESRSDMRFSDTRFSDTRFSDTRYSDTRYSDTRFSDTRFSGTQNDEHVRAHYNTVKNNMRDRTNMMPLRDFNNFVKWLLVFEYSQPYDVVLDMACGKGGDLEKWRRACVDGWIGVDIADVSISDATKRYERLRPKTFWADFLVGNCFGTNIKETVLHPDTPEVDVVSCQFALHYAFDTQERINTALANVSSVLKTGGLFFGTMPNPDYLLQNLQQALREGKREWGNSIFNIKFDEDVEIRDGKFVKPFGNGYTFYLSEAVDNVPEYTISIDQLAALAQKHGLELIQKEPFLDYFDRCVRDSELVLNEAAFKKLTNRTGRRIFDANQMEVCSIYLCYGFRKI